MASLDALTSEMLLSRRYMAAQAWVSSKASSEAGTNPLKDAVVDGKRFVDLLEDAHQAVGAIWAGAAALPSSPDLMARVDSAVAAFEGACTALGYRRVF